MIVPELKNEPLTFADLRERYDTQRGITWFDGRYKRKGLESYVVTPVGEIKRTDWERMLRQLIREAGEENLFSHLLGWMAENTPWLRKESEKISYALELHAARVFDNEAWVGFVQFNEKYRPERLKTAGLASVKTACCGKYSIVTTAQLHRDDGKVCCPYCGRFSEYEIDKGEQDGHE